VVAAILFDMDGVIADTEHVWDEVREVLVADWGGTYSPGAQQAMMGMSSVEWSAYMHDVVGLPQGPEEINDEDSTNGIRAAAAAGMSVIAYPNRFYPPDANVLALAHAVIDSLDELVPTITASQDAGQGLPRTPDHPLTA
jgi:beta-phosphoglucomutase-like phosphatase (HAD superfamily)